MLYGAMANNEAVLIIDVQKAFCDAALYRRAWPDLREGLHWCVGDNKKNAAAIRDFAATVRGKIPLIWVGYHPYGEGVQGQWVGEPLSSGPGMFYLAHPAEGEPVFYKGEDSAFSNRALPAFLKAAGMQKIYITGMNLDACVYDTVKSAWEDGYDVEVLSDLVSTASLIAEEQDLAIDNMMQGGVPFSRSKELLARLAADHSLPKLGGVGNAGEGDFRANVTGLCLRADPQF